LAAEPSSDAEPRLSKIPQLGEAVISLYKQGKYAEAEPLLLETLAIVKAAYGVQHVKYAEQLVTVASMYRIQHADEKAEPLFLESLSIYEKLEQQNDPDYARSLAALADLQLGQARYGDAIALFQKLLALRKDTLGERHPEYAQTLCRLAECYYEQGEYALAEPIYLEAVTTCREVLGERHPDFAQSLSNLALLYIAQGNLARAEPLLFQVIDIRREVVGKEHEDYALALNNLGGFYCAERNYDLAEPLYLQALAIYKIYKEKLGGQHRLYANTLNNLAELYHAQHKDADAEPLYLEAREINHAVFGEHHPQYANSLNNLGGLYFSQGKLAEAESLFRQASNIYQAAYGSRHTLFATSLNNLAMLHFAQRAFGESLRESSQAAEITRSQLDETAAVQSEQQQLESASQLDYFLEHYLSAAAAAKMDPAKVYSQVLAWKGAVTRRQATMRSLRRDLQADAKARETFAELDNVTRQLAAQINVVPTPEQGAAHRQHLTELHQQVERLQKSLAGKSANYAANVRQQRCTSDDMRQAIPEDSVLIDVVEYNRYGWWNGEQSRPTWKRVYAAFVTGAAHGVSWIDLGPAEPIDAAVELWRVKLTQSVPPADSPAGILLKALKTKWQQEHGNLDPDQALKSWVWDKLAAQLGTARLVLISPDGALSKLPWGALPGEKPGTYVIEENRMIALAPFPQMLPDMLATKSPFPENGSLLVVSDVSYGGDPGGLPTASVAKRARQPGGDKWPPLPATKQEGTAIAEVFRKRFVSGRVHGLEQLAATEGAVREFAPQSQYLHLATHGFFANPSNKSALDGSNDESETIPFGMESRQRITGFHPGLLSGIVLAGANQPLTANQDDGILTALEVSELDLRQTNLVTLSACETGLGATAGGEGVLGLQRALQLAGARTTVASLWQVSDDATRRLMVNFYDNLWDKELPVLESLHAAQLSMLRAEAQDLPSGRRGLDIAKQPVGNGKRLPPYYWAAFVLAGDWR
jgi:CHAT domain-containing protein